MSAESNKNQFPIQEEKNDFKTQFEKREFFEGAGGRIEVVDVIPEQLKDKVPLFIASGWGCSIEVYEQVFKIMVERGRRTISLNHPRQGGDLENKATEAEIDTYPIEKLRKSYNILDVIEQKNIEKVDVLAHSEGAMNAILAAVLHPEKFRNIVLFGPAGMIGKDNFLDLTK